jgi:hypothetical protein
MTLNVGTVTFQTLLVHALDLKGSVRRVTHPILMRRPTGSMIAREPTIHRSRVLDDSNWDL